MNLLSGNLGRLFILGLLGLSLWGALAPYDLSVFHFVNHDAPEVARFEATMAELESTSTLTLLFDAGPTCSKRALATIHDHGAKATQIETCIQRLEHAEKRAGAILKNHGAIASFGETLSKEEALGMAPLMLDDASFATLLKWSADASGTYDEELRDTLLHTQSALARYRWLDLQLKGELMREALSHEELLSLEHDLRMKALEVDVTTGLTGQPAVIAHDHVRSIERFQWLTPLSFILVLLIFIRMRPSLSTLLAIALSLALSAGATFGLMRSFFGTLTIMETLFGVLLFGLSIDFAMHLLFRFREERHVDSDARAALLRTLNACWRPLLVGAMSTSAVFAALVLTGDKMMVRLGVVGAFGVALGVVLMISMLAMLWLRFPEAKDSRNAKTALKTFLGAMTRRPRLAMSSSALLIIGSALASTQIVFETDMSKLIQRDLPPIEVASTLAEEFGFTSSPWISTHNHSDELKKMHAFVNRDPRFSKVESIATLMDAHQKRSSALKHQGRAIENHLKTLEVLFELDDESEEVRIGIQILQRLIELSEEERFSPEALPQSLKRRLLTPSGDSVARIYPTKAGLDAAEARAQRQALRAEGFRSSSVLAVIESIFAPKMSLLVRTLAIMLGLIFTMCMIDLRSIRLSVLTLVPVVTSVVTSLGFLTLIGFKMTSLSIMILPLIIGLGLDDGIHVTHRYLENPRAGAIEAATQVGTALTYTTVTTLASFGVLLFSGAYALENLGWVMVVAIPIAWLASLTLLPILLDRFAPPNVLAVKRSEYV